jgi:regulator of sigma E protease
MAWVIAIAGIILLIILHEAGHFAAAKAVGMRVERFSLFFPPTLAKIKRGETEYAIGAIPAGGYVKITGMSPEELADLDPELRARAYYSQPPWKRVVVILAGPGMNLLIAFALFAAVLMSGSLGGDSVIENLYGGSNALAPTSTWAVYSTLRHTSAATAFHPGDVFVKVDGRTPTLRVIESASHSDRCAGALVNGCRGARPVSYLVKRGKRDVRLALYPHYDAKHHAMLIGFDLAQVVKPAHFGLAAALGTSARTMWNITASTVTGLAHAITSSKARSQLSGIVGITQITEQAVASGPGKGLVIIAFVSLVLGVINLFPFLPLDGGHVLWSVAEKLRGARIRTETMWKFSSVGIVLLAFLVVSGLSNNISNLAGS